MNLDWLKSYDTKCKNAKCKIGKIDKTGEFMQKYFQVFLSIFMNIPIKN